MVGYLRSRSETAPVRLREPGFPDSRHFLGGAASPAIFAGFAADMRPAYAVLRALQLPRQQSSTKSSEPVTIRETGLLGDWILCKRDAK